VQRTIGRAPLLAGGRLRPLALSSSAAAAAALVVRPHLGDLPPLAGGVLAAAVFGLVYLVVTVALRVPEAQDLRGAIRRRLRR
jgi:hypothetical protein